MSKKIDNNGRSIVIDKPVPKASAKGAYREQALREAAEAEAKEAASTKATRNRDKLKKTAADIAKRKKQADAKAKAEAKANADKAKKALAKADAKAKKLAGEEAKFAANFAKADAEATGAAVTMAVTARKLFAERVLGLKDKDAHLLLHVSGTGVTMPRFSDGIRLLGFHKGFRMDDKGKLPEKEFAICRAVYNTANGKLNELLAKVDAAKSSKYTVTASPKPKKGKGGERSAVIAKRTKVNLASLKSAGAMTLAGWESLLLVCDSSARILDVGAARLVNDAAAFVKAGNGAMAKLGRHVRNLRASATLTRPAYAIEATLAAINAKGKDAKRAMELHPMLLADAQAAILAAKVAMDAKATTPKRAQIKVA